MVILYIGFKNTILLFLGTSEFSNVSSRSKNNKQDIDLPGEILRKEGNEDCDAIILEKALESEHVNLASQNQDSDCESSKEKSDNGKQEFFFNACIVMLKIK